MPHVTTEQTTPHTTSRSQKSSFLTHLSTYPILTQALSTLKTNPYSSSALSYADAFYAHYITPYVHENKTYNVYAAPYVSKADSLADAGLARVDKTFPIIQEDPSVWVETSKRVLIEEPLKKWDHGVKYVRKTYEDEYTKTRSPHRSNTADTTTTTTTKPHSNNSLLTTVLAIISTILKIIQDIFHATTSTLGPPIAASRSALVSRAEDFQGEAKRYRAVYVRAGKETAEVWKRAGEETIGSTYHATVNGDANGKVVDGNGKVTAVVVNGE